MIIIIIIIIIIVITIIITVYSQLNPKAKKRLKKL